MSFLKVSSVEQLKTDRLNNHTYKIHIYKSISSFVTIVCTYWWLTRDVTFQQHEFLKNKNIYMCVCVFENLQAVNSSYRGGGHKVPHSLRNYWQLMVV